MLPHLLGMESRALYILGKLSNNYSLAPFPCDFCLWSLSTFLQASHLSPAPLALQVKNTHLEKNPSHPVTTPF